MSRLDDLFDFESEAESPRDGIQIDMSILCPVCNQDPDRAYYNRNKKKVTTVCEDHESSFDMDLSFIYG